MQWIDTQCMQVDNMFVADHLEVYCSELGKGIAVFACLQVCLALLSFCPRVMMFRKAVESITALQQSGEARQDRARQERVEFLREILRVPLKHLLPVNETGDYMHRPLESWSLADLERFLTELWTNGPQPAGEPGPWLRESIGILADRAPNQSGSAIMVCAILGNIPC